jgi:hypothetical protein
MRKTPIQEGLGQFSIEPDGLGVRLHGSSVVLVPEEGISLVLQPEGVFGLKIACRCLAAFAFGHGRLFDLWEGVSCG